MHSTPRPPEVVDSPRCNMADAAWYVRMPRDAPLVEPEVEMQLVQHEEENATLEATISVTDNWLPH